MEGHLKGQEMGRGQISKKTKQSITMEQHLQFWTLLRIHSSRICSSRLYGPQVKVVAENLVGMLLVTSQSLLLPLRTLVLLKIQSLRE